jgi:hypothetical protein
MNDLHELDVRINAAGESASAMMNTVVEAVKRGVDLEVFRPFIVPLAEHGLRLAAIQAWSEAAKAAQRAPTLPPGLVVADVNGADEPVGHGGVDPQLCTPGNWSYYQQHNLGARWAEIFSGPLSAAERGDRRKPRHHRDGAAGSAGARRQRQRGRGPVDLRIGAP